MPPQHNPLAASIASTPNTQFPEPESKPIQKPLQPKHVPGATPIARRRRWPQDPTLVNTPLNGINTPLSGMTCYVKSEMNVFESVVQVEGAQPPISRT